jgi:hypothetical protein
LSNSDPDLDVLIQAWPTLSPDLRKMILKVIHAAH